MTGHTDGSLLALLADFPFGVGFFGLMSSSSSSSELARKLCFAGFNLVAATDCLLVGGFMSSSSLSDSMRRFADILARGLEDDADAFVDAFAEGFAGDAFEIFEELAFGGGEAEGEMDIAEGSNLI